MLPFSFRGGDRRPQDGRQDPRFSSGARNPVGVGDLSRTSSRSSGGGGRLDQQRPGLRDRESGYPGGGNDPRRDDRSRMAGPGGSRGTPPQQPQQQPMPSPMSAPPSEPVEEASEKLLNKVNGFVNEFVDIKDEKEALQVCGERYIYMCV